MRPANNCLEIMVCSFAMPFNCVWLPIFCSCILMKEGREGVKWEMGLALLWTGKMGFTHWDWDLATGNGMNNYKMGMGFLFFSGLCSNILK